MTKEQYEGTPELIFYCEYNPNDFEDRLEIPFTNEYDIKLDFSRDEDNQICINVDFQPKESNIPKDFFGKNILNVTAIAGKNGVGKTKIFHRIYSGMNILDYSSFIIYQDNNNHFIIESTDTYMFSMDGFEFLINTQNNINNHRERVSLEKYNLLISNALLIGYFDECHLARDDSLFFKRLKAENHHAMKLNILKNNDFSYMFSLMNPRCFLGVQVLNQKSKLNNKGLFIRTIFESLLKLYNIQIDPNEGFTTDIFSHIDIPKNHFLETKLNKLLDRFLEQLNKLELEEFICHDGLIQLSSKYSDLYLIINLSITINKCINKDIIHIWFEKGSSGEDSLLQIVASIQAAILFDAGLPGLHNIIRFNSVIILLDEYEQHLHPEWARRYLSYLLKFLNVEGERLGIKFQVILTTHSPYLISDLPKENIILLEKDEETGKRTARKSNYGFASNYYDIMSDNFFLDDTIGEFAKQKINDCIQAINHISDDLDKLVNDELTPDDELSPFIEKRLKTIEEQNKIIALIGDKFIQKQLQQLSDSVKQRLLAHGDDSVRKQQIEQDIAELEEKLRQKKMELNND